MVDEQSLPDAAKLALWISAWLDARVSPDDLRDAVVADDAAHHVAGLPGEPEPLPLILAVGKLRGAGAVAAGLALPAAGDPVGLAGPPAFNEEALEIGEAVLLDGAGFGLVPHRAGAGVVWQCHPAETRRQVPDHHEASTGLRRALVEAATRLAELDVARWRPEVADELITLRKGKVTGLPPGLAAPALPLISQALLCLRVVDLALVDDGAAVTATEMTARREALAPLDRAARRGLVAACSM